MNDSQAQSDSPRSPLSSSPRGLSVGKLCVLLLFALLFGIGYFQFGDELTLEYLSGRESELREIRQQRPILVFAIAFCLYVAVAGLSLPGGATMLSLASAWFFGFWQALLLVSFASTSGATVAFLMSRYLFRDAIESRFGDRLERFNRALQREGPFYLFSLRLIPAVPFFAINVVMGLTPIRARTYWWVSQIGMLPGTCVYLFAGSQFPTLTQLANDGVKGILTPPILIAFALLGLFPILIKKWHVRKKANSQSAGKP